MTLALAAVAASAGEAVAGPNGSSPATPVRSCESLAALSLANTTIDSAVADPGGADQPPSCQVHLSVTHPPAGDDVNIDIWLPTRTWNGRFQGTGGGGFSGGSPANLPQPLRNGYAAGATDTGHAGARGSFALNPDGTLNWQLIKDNAYLAVHEMTVAGKALVRAFYGTAPRYSYFNGCSTGGRQGLIEAQRYAADYDGVAAGSPAINATKLRVVQLWGELVMLRAGNFVAQCKFEAATAAAVQACDDLDGVHDGVIGDPRQCHFDPSSLVGTPTPCGAITAADADVMRKIWEGARTISGGFLWYGLARGASFSGLSDTTTVDGQTVGAPSTLTLDWYRYFLLRDPDWDWRAITPEQFERLFAQSVQQFSAVTAGDDPDLRAFAAHGGKIVMWHGWSDQLVYPEGSIDYYDRVARAVGGAAKARKFVRLFMAPGAAHCGGGAGPASADELGAVVRWVEQGEAPATLLAEKRDASGALTQTRPLCPYPLVARYRGHGSTDDAASFACKRDFGTERDS
jgi:Tannase and feruloyl esterase